MISPSSSAASVSGVIREAVIAAVLTGLMILLFLGSWRTTIIIAVSIPLSILTSIIILGCLGQTINIMTLGGLALAVGILVDDATVTIENIERYLEEGQPAQRRHPRRRRADRRSRPRLHPLHLHRLPADVLPQRRLALPLRSAGRSGRLRHARLVRALANPRPHACHVPAQSARPPCRPLAQHLRHASSAASSVGFESIRNGYQGILAASSSARLLFVPVFLLICICAIPAVPSSARTSSPAPTPAPSSCTRAPRAEPASRRPPGSATWSKQSIRRTIPADEIDNILDNIGLPYSTLNFQHATSGLIGAGDADILVSLKENHHPTADYVRTLRNDLGREFPGTIFYFLPSDIVTQILNFGLPAPIDVQFEGADIVGNRKVANTILAQMRQVPGLTDLRIQQPDDYPVLNITVDRTKASAGRIHRARRGRKRSQHPQRKLAAQPAVLPQPQERRHLHHRRADAAVRHPDPQRSAEHPHHRHDGEAPRDPRRRRHHRPHHRDRRSSSHYNIRRTLDIYGNVQDRDLGAVAEADRQDRQGATRSPLPRGSFIHVRGQVETMRSSYLGLLGGLAFAIVLVYLLIVVNFQSWLDPFIIITALPAALAGIVLFLFLTHTTSAFPR